MQNQKWYWTTADSQHIDFHKMRNTGGGTGPPLRANSLRNSLTAKNMNVRTPFPPTRFDLNAE